MESKHTKGEWQIYTPPCQIEPFAAFIYDPPQRTTIAAVHDRRRIVSNDKKEAAAEETVANAKLIAAAPSMLETLNYLQTAIESMPAFRKIDIIKQNEIIHKINKAINATK